MNTINETLAHEWFEEVWNKKQIESIDRLLAQDVVAHGLGDQPGIVLRGVAGFKTFYQKFTQAFPDIHVTVEDTITEGDKIAVRCVVRASHLGDSLGMPATGRLVEFTGIAILRIKDGKIVEGWNNFDFQTLALQIGAPLPGPAPAGVGQ